MIVCSNDAGDLRQRKTRTVQKERTTQTYALLTYVHLHPPRRKKLASGNTVEAHVCITSRWKRSNRLLGAAPCQGSRTWSYPTTASKKPPRAPPTLTLFPPLTLTRRFHLHDPPRYRLLLLFQPLRRPLVRRCSRSRHGFGKGGRASSRRTILARHPRP